MSRLEYGQVKCNRYSCKGNYSQDKLTIVPTPVGDFVVCPDCRKELVAIFAPQEDGSNE